MADNSIYDLLDEVNCADSCESVIALCELIDELLKDIQHLELECISTRYLLSMFPEPCYFRLLDELLTQRRVICRDKVFYAPGGIGSLRV